MPNAIIHLGVIAAAFSLAASVKRVTGLISAYRATATANASRASGGSGRFTAATD
jgi:hypothetical protein